MTTWYLVAGGASLEGFDFERLRGKHVLAINMAYAACPFAEILYWSDWRFYDWHREGIARHRAYRKITALRKYDNDHGYDLKKDKVEIWRFTGMQGLDRSPMGLRSGNNSGYAAINVAIHFGASRIYLLGYDMKVRSDGQVHWHPDHPVRGSDHRFNNMVIHFPTLIEPLRKMGVQVINLNPDSALDCFPKKSIDEVLI